jgi:type II restriction/modification system DNA methylase subunit YeeA
MTVSQFIQKWKRSELKERSAAHEHFLDLCELFDHPKPADDDPTGERFTFEKGAGKLDGGDGWADVWKKGFFAWEYKGRHLNLDAAYRQLQEYRDALENPPLLVACDTSRFVISTNFTNTPVEKYEIALADLVRPEKLEILRAVFFDPDKLKPGVFREQATQRAARHIGEIAQTLRARGLEPHRVARFLDRIVFSMFAEDVGLLPDGTFTRMVRGCKGKTALFGRMLGQLFEAMAEGTTFGVDAIRHFNGDLFADVEVLELLPVEIQHIGGAADLDWGKIDPSIFGTLFERGLDPGKRSQLGAHYTSRVDIETIVDPVVMQPLRREWDAVREQAEAILSLSAEAKPTDKKKALLQVENLLHDFLLRIASVRVLDPACGSGNFLYVTLQRLLDLDKEVSDWSLAHDLPVLTSEVGPWQLYGIEINPYAHDLAQTTIWIGYLQWMHDNRSGASGDPVLRCMDNFRNTDAIIDLSDPENPKEPEWPEVDFIVGNPPFLGGKLMRGVLGDEYMDSLFTLWRDRVRPESDLCCYWFEKARGQIEDGKCKRAGLLATQGIRGGANRETLKRIKESGDIFFAESDRPWILDGANVHVSMVGFDDGLETAETLDGASVDVITPQLTSGMTVCEAIALSENSGISFMGVTPAGAFDIEFGVGARFLQEPNPTGVPNSDVVRPYLNGKDLNQRPRHHWSIDYGVDTSLEKAASYAAPFDYALGAVKPARGDNRRDAYRINWWLYAEPRPAMRSAFAGHPRFLATCMVAKHRIFVWLPTVAVPANVVIVFARSDDYFFGVLHSRLHEVWALQLGTRLETRPRYTPTTCFETFPFPEPTAEQEAAIAEAARELNELREAWLNPPEWTREEILEFPGSVDGPWASYVHDPDSRGIGTVRYPRIAPKDGDCAEALAVRTLTNLYNQRPGWLDLAHKKLDEAVFAAYGWDSASSDDQILEKLLELNLARASEV